MLRTFLSNEYLALVARIFLGFVFLVASIDKVADPDAFAIAVANYKLVGSSVGMAVATILPWVELLCGLSLLFGANIRSSSLLVFLMLAVFTGGVISGLVRGLDISCGCFTKDPTVDKIGWMKAAENVGLLLMTSFVFYSNAVRYSLEKYLVSKREGDKVNSL